MNFHSSNIKQSVTKYYHLLLLMLFLAFIPGCDSIVFDNKIDTILEPVDQVNFLSVSSSAINDSTWTKTPNREKAVRLLIGKIEGYESAALLRFGKLSELPVESLIKSLFVQLTVINTISKQPSSSILLSMYRNRVEWNENNVVNLKLEDFTPLPEDLIDTTTVLWSNSDSTSEKFSFDIPFSLVQSWIDSSDTNGVIIIGDSSSDFIISSPARTSALSSSLEPLLQVKYTDSDTTITTGISATGNGYLLSISTGLPLSDPDRTYIGGGKAYRGIYKFNSGLFDGISETSKISRAELNLAIDVSRSILPIKNSSVTGIGDTLYFSYLDSSSEGGDLFPTTQSNFSFAKIPIDGNIISLNMTNILQRWVSDNIEERGLVIWSGSEESHLFRVALYKEGCDVTADASCVEPELNIYYTTTEGIEE